MGDAFNHWFHCTCHTYGSWLHGDPRGFRTRHRREHVDGDYKRPPPPGKYDAKFQRSKSLMQRPPVVLLKLHREIVAASIAASLRRRNVEVLAVAMDRIHLHVLARFVQHDARDLLGIAKREAWNELRIRGMFSRAASGVRDRDPNPCAIENIRSRPSSTSNVTD